MISGLETLQQHIPGQPLCNMAIHASENEKKTWSNNSSWRLAKSDEDFNKFWLVRMQVCLILQNSLARKGAFRHSLTARLQRQMQVKLIANVYIYIYMYVYMYICTDLRVSLSLSFFLSPFVFLSLSLSLSLNKRKHDYRRSSQPSEEYLCWLGGQQADSHMQPR